MKSTMASASDLLAEILSRQEFSKLRDMTAEAANARTKVEEIRAKSGFWRQWTVSKDVSTVKFVGTAEQLSDELGHAAQLESEVDKLGEAVSDLRDRRSIYVKRHRID